MTNFIYDIPTKNYFGPDQLEHLSEEISRYGKRVLLVYGGGSIKKTGLYNALAKEVKKAGASLFELGGVEPNPRIESVRKGAALCKENKIEVIVAAGGGSAMDAAKLISAAALVDFDPWLFMAKKEKIQETLPVITVLTISATGSEMNPTCVISNPETDEKTGLTDKHLFPKAAFCNPLLTYSVNTYQTACGSADILSHIMEVYFNTNQELYMLDRSMEAMMKTVIKYAPIALAKQDDYEARANLMWTSSWAINGYISGCNKSPWSCHPIEHQLSAVYDITHGLGLAIVTPRWMEFVLDEITAQKFCDYGTNVWGLPQGKDKMESAKAAIEKTKEFFYKTLGLKSSLSELGITDEHFAEMAKKACGSSGTINGWKNLTPSDVEAIYRASL